VAVRHHLDLGHTKPSVLNGLDEEPICVGQDRDAAARSGSSPMPICQAVRLAPVAGVEGQRYA
jgi:hypothetical protein